MDRHVTPKVRAGALTVAAATGLMMLASTGQTPSGFVPAAFGGPLGLFEAPALDGMTDVLAIGDGTVDANDLAALLETTGPSTTPAGPMQAAALTPATAAELALLPPAIEPNSAPVAKESLNLKPVLDSRGQVDCSKAVSCVVDPATNTTTVTFSDGVVAVVQKINDLTLVAYKTLSDVFDGLLPDGIPALPAAAVPPPVVSASAPEVSAPKISARPQTQEPSVSAGPVAPSGPAAAPDLSASDVRPTLTISKPPLDFDLPAGGSKDDDAPDPTSGAVDAVKGAVKGAVDSVVGAVTDAVKSIGPGAATTETGGADAKPDKPAAE